MNAAGGVAVWQEFLRFLRPRRGRAIGASVGLVVSVSIITWGFLRTLFVCLAVAAGYLVGRYMDEGVDWLGEWLQRWQSPGRR